MSDRKFTCKEVRLIEFAHNTWCDNVEHGVEYEDILKPEYWVHIARGVKVGDHIQARALDGSFFAWLMIEAVTNTGVYVSEIFLRNKPGVIDKPSLDDFVVQFVPKGDDRWRIVRTSDKVVVDRGYPDKPSAEAAMNALIGKVSESSKAEV